MTLSVLSSPALASGLNFFAMIFPIVHIGAIVVSFLFVVMMLHIQMSAKGFVEPDKKCLISEEAIVRSGTGRHASLVVVGYERKEGGTTNKVTDSFTHSLCSARKCLSFTHSSPNVMRLVKAAAYALGGDSRPFFLENISLFPSSLPPAGQNRGRPPP
ncbi:unnamed protein product [Prunus armeniaca]